MPRGADGRRGAVPSAEKAVVIRAKHGWLFWLEVSFLVIICAGCGWAATFLALEPTGPNAFGYRLVLLIAAPFALLHFGLVNLLRPDRVLEANEEGLSFSRGTKLRWRLPWSEVHEFRFTRLARGSKYHGRVQEGYRVSVSGKDGRRRATLDTVRYDLPAADLLGFERTAATLARINAIPVSESSQSDDPARWP